MRQFSCGRKSGENIYLYEGDAETDGVQMPVVFMMYYNTVLALWRRKNL